MFSLYFRFCRIHVPLLPPLLCSLLSPSLPLSITYHSFRTFPSSPLSYYSHPVSLLPPVPPSFPLTLLPSLPPFLLPSLPPFLPFTLHPSLLPSFPPSLPFTPSPPSPPYHRTGRSSYLSQLTKVETADSLLLEYSYVTNQQEMTMFRIRTLKKGDNYWITSYWSFYTDKIYRNIFLFWSHYLHNFSFTFYIYQFLISLNYCFHLFLAAIQWVIRIRIAMTLPQQLSPRPL